MVRDNIPYAKIHKYKGPMARGRNAYSRNQKQAGEAGTDSKEESWMSEDWMRKVSRGQTTQGHEVRVRSLVFIL